MAAQSSSGNLPLYNSLSFQHHCLSSISNPLSIDSWIINSGETSHVCYDLEKFSDLYSVTGVTFSLPNGIREPITHMWTVRISSFLVFYNVFHVPSFLFNLISVICLLHVNNFDAHFHPNFLCYLEIYSATDDWLSNSYQQYLYT